MIKNENGKVEIQNTSIAETMLELQEIISECQKRLTNENDEIFFEAMLNSMINRVNTLNEDRNKAKEDISNLRDVEVAFIKLLNYAWGAKGGKTNDGR